MAKKLLPPQKVVEEEGRQQRDRQLLDSVVRHVHEILDIDTLAGALVRKANRKVSLQDIPATMQKWATMLAPEHWRDRVRSLVGGRVSDMDREIHRLAQAAVRTIAQEADDDV